MDDNCRCVMKPNVEKLIRRVNSLRVVTESLPRVITESPANFSNKYQKDPSDVTKREKEDTTVLHDGNVELESQVDKFKKKLSDLQEILKKVADLVQCCMKENIPCATTSLMEQMNEVIIDIHKESQLATREDKTALIPRINVGVKRGRDVDGCVVEHHDNITTKRPKTNGKMCSEKMTTERTNSFVKRNTRAAEVDIRNFFKTRTSCKPTNINTEKSDVRERTFNFSRVVVEELSPYYNKNYFENKDLFKLLVKSIVHKILDYSMFERACYQIDGTTINASEENKIGTSNCEPLKPFF